MADGPEIHGVVQAPRRSSARKRHLKRGVTQRVAFQKPIDPLTLSVIRRDNYVIATATSNLAGRVYYHWYINGQFRSSGLANTKTFFIRDGDTLRIECIDTNNPVFDSIANAPESVPDRFTIFWLQSQDTDVAEYSVQQNKDAGGWSEIARITHDDGQWAYEFTTERLVDLSTYQFRVIPYDVPGNAGTALTMTSEKIVRTPDAPNWDDTYDEGTDKLTWSAA
jgi:hypothetical protein